MIPEYQWEGFRDCRLKRGASYNYDRTSLKYARCYNKNPVSFAKIIFECRNISGEYPDILNRGSIINPADGHAYKIMYQSQPWHIAKKNCEELNAKLAVPKSDAEFKFIQKVVRKMHYPSITGSKYKLLAWLGISSQEDFTKWMNVDGENIESGFHTWAHGNGYSHSDDPAEPHCAGIDGINYGLRDYWCHLRQPYICETVMPNTN